MCLIGVLVDVSVGVSPSSIMGICVLNEFSNFGFIPSSVIEDGTSSMIIGSTTLPHRKCKLLQERGEIEYAGMLEVLKCCTTLLLGLGLGRACS